MTNLPLELLDINQLGERIEAIIENPKMFPPGQLRVIAQMLKKYKFGILVGVSFDEGAHVTAIATIETPYEEAQWLWGAQEGWRDSGVAYRDPDFEKTLQGQATLNGLTEPEEDEDDD